MKNSVARAIYAANRDKSSVTINLRLKKNGRFSSVQGIVEGVRVSRDGYPYIIVDRADGEHMQTVILSNILSVHKDGVLYRQRTTLRFKNH